VKKRPRGIGQWLAWGLVTGGGLGLSPFAPGTVGALPGFLLVAAIHALSSPLWAGALLAVAVLVSVPLATWGERFYGEKDPSPVVIDEIVALPITAAFAPCSATYLAVAFVFNRALDIMKPFPAHRAQRLPHGWGIVVDDVISGLYAGLLLWVLYRIGDEWIVTHVPAWATRVLIPEGG
jgi:phosphatidylglycerophosphatase A